MSEVTARTDVSQPNLALMAEVPKLCRRPAVTSSQMQVAPSRYAAVLRRGSSNARQPASAADLSRRRLTRCAWVAPLRRLQAVRCSPKRSSSARRLRPIVTDREREGRGIPHLQHEYSGGRLGLSATGSHHHGCRVFRPLPAGSCGQVLPWRTSTVAAACPSERQG